MPSADIVEKLRALLSDEPNAAAVGLIRPDILTIIDAIESLRTALAAATERAEKAEADRDALGAEVRAWRAFNDAEMGQPWKARDADDSRKATDASGALSRCRPPAAADAGAEMPGANGGTDAAS